METFAVLYLFLDELRPIYNYCGTFAFLINKRKMVLDLDGAWVVLFGLSTKKIGSCSLFVFMF